jgi:hypothetical protein
MIKAALASFAALMLVAGAGSHADAANQKKQRYSSHYGKQSSPKAAYGYSSPATGNGSSNYYEHVLDKVPFGSQRWWQIYEEQHGGPN